MRLNLARNAVLATVTSSLLATSAPALAQSAAPESNAAPKAPERGARAEAMASAPAPVSAVPAPTPAEIRYRRLSVDIESTRPSAVLERRVTEKESSGAFLFLPYRSSESTWEQVCVAPCQGADLDRYSTYRVAAANGISSSGPFTLPQSDSTVHLKLDAGNRFAHRVGVGLSGAGIAATIVGASLIWASSDVVNHDNETRTRNAGFITGGAGIVALAIGIPLALLTRTTVYADDKPVKEAEAKGRFMGNGFTF